MHYTKSFTGAAVLLALAPSALALGTATVVNGCGFDVYYAPISGNAQGMVALAPGASYSEGYGNEGQGTSIKVSPNDSTSGSITQFEFTWAAGKINYDISNIDGNPFAAEGMMLSPSMEGDSSNPTCVPVACPAGQDVCTAAYNQPDDTRTMVCNEASNLVFTVCAGGGAKVKREAKAHSDNAERHSHRVHSRHILKK